MLWQGKRPDWVLGGEVETVGRSRRKAFLTSNALHTKVVCKLSCHPVLLPQEVSMVPLSGRWVFLENFRNKAHEFHFIC